MMRPARILAIALFVVSVCRWNPALIAEENGKVAADVQVPRLPDKDLVTAYRHAATQNVLAAVNPQVFPGYFSVCADGIDVTYSGSAAQRLGVRFGDNDDVASWKVTSQGAAYQISGEGGIVWLVLPSTSDVSPRHFRVQREAG